MRADAPRSLRPRPPRAARRSLETRGCGSPRAPAAAALLQIDGTIVTVALPSVGDELDVGRAQPVAGPDRLLRRLRADAVSRAACSSTGSARGASRSRGLGVFAAGAVLGALAQSFERAGRVAAGAGRRRRPRQPRFACGRRVRLSARAARLGARALGRELRRGEPDRPADRRPAHGRDRLARVLVVPRARPRRAAAWAIARFVPRDGPRGRAARRGRACASA